MTREEMNALAVTLSALVRQGKILATFDGGEGTDNPFQSIESVTVSAFAFKEPHLIVWYRNDEVHGDRDTPDNNKPDDERREIMDAGRDVMTLLLRRFGDPTDHPEAQRRVLNTLCATVLYAISSDSADLTAATAVLDLLHSVILENLTTLYAKRVQDGGPT